MPSGQVAVFHLTAIGATSPALFPSGLKDLLEHPKLVAVGVQIGGDLSRLKRLGVKVRRRIELRDLAKRHDSNQKDGTGLAALTRCYLEQNIDKSGQSHTNDYSMIPLPTHLVEYAALDALLALLLVQKLLPLVSNTIPGQAVIESPKSLNVGTLAELHIGGQMVAEVMIEFVGTSTQGKSWKWGNLLIGKGKAPIKLERIFVGRAKPPYLYKDGNDGWPD